MANHFSREVGRQATHRSLSELIKTLRSKLTSNRKTKD